MRLFVLNTDSNQIAIIKTTTIKTNKQTNKTKNCPP